MKLFIHLKGILSSTEGSFFSTDPIKSNALQVTDKSRSQIPFVPCSLVLAHVERFRRGQVDAAHDLVEHRRREDVGLVEGEVGSGPPVAGDLDTVGVVAPGHEACDTTCVVGDAPMDFLSLIFQRTVI